MLIGTIRARGSRLIGARRYGSCLIGAREIGACGSELGRTEPWIGAMDWCSCGSMLVIRVVIGVVDWCCGSELWIGAAVDRCL